jgi:hypothetical protein
MVGIPPVGGRRMSGGYREEDSKALPGLNHYTESLLIK